jgi:hypothetical protein
MIKNNDFNNKINYKPLIVAGSFKSANTITHNCNTDNLNIGNIYNLKKLGINNNNPKFELDVIGNINLTGNIYKYGQEYNPYELWSVNSSNGSIFYIISEPYNRGNVGINTANPQRFLDVNGDAILRDTVEINKKIVLNKNTFINTSGGNYINLQTESYINFDNKSFLQVPNIFPKTSEKTLQIMAAEIATLNGIRTSIPIQSQLNFLEVSTIAQGIRISQIRYNPTIKTTIIKNNTQINNLYLSFKDSANFSGFLYYDVRTGYVSPSKIDTSFIIINTSNIADGAVTTVKIADSAVTTSKIKSSAITDDLVAYNINYNKLTKYTISGIELGNNLKYLNINNGLIGTTSIGTSSTYYNGSNLVNLSIDDTIVATVNGVQTLAYKTLLNPIINNIINSLGFSILVPNIQMNNYFFVTTGDVGTVTNNMISNNSITVQKLSQNSVSGSGNIVLANYPTINNPNLITPILNNAKATSINGYVDTLKIDSKIINLGDSSTNINIGQNKNNNIITLGNISSNVIIPGTLIYTKYDEIIVTQNTITLNDGGISPSGAGLLIEYQNNGVEYASILIGDSSTDYSYIFTSPYGNSAITVNEIYPINNIINNILLVHANLNVNNDINAIGSISSNSTLTCTQLISTITNSSPLSVI